jgi:hypothetical protein
VTWRLLPLGLMLLPVTWLLPALLVPKPVLNLAWTILTLLLPMLAQTWTLKNLQVAQA